MTKHKVSAMTKITKIKSAQPSQQDLINDTANTSNERWIACLLSIAKDSDRQSFYYLFEYFAPKLKSFFMQRGVQAAEAEELIQEAFVTIWQKANYYSANKAYVSTWIYTIARNKKLDRDRKNVRHQKYINSLDNNEPELSRDDPFEYSSRTELINYIQELPSPQPEILKCVYFEGKSHQATADEMHITLGTVKGQIRSALNRLRTLVKT